jgi:hypothetical protein
MKARPIRLLCSSIELNKKRVCVSFRLLSSQPILRTNGYFYYIESYGTIRRLDENFLKCRPTGLKALHVWRNVTQVFLSTIWSHFLFSLFLQRQSNHRFDRIWYHAWRYGAIMRTLSCRVLDQVLLYGLVHAVFPHSLRHSSGSLCAHCTTSDPRTGTDQQSVFGRSVLSSIGSSGDCGRRESLFGWWQRESATEEKEQDSASPKLQ